MDGPRRSRLRLVAVLSLVLGTLPAIGTGAWWYRQREARSQAELTRRFERALAGLARDPRTGDEHPQTPAFPDTPLGRIYRRVLDEQRESMRLVAGILARYREEHDAWAALATAQPEAAWLAARTTAVAALRADLDAYEKSLTALGRFLDESSGPDEWTREAARKLHPGRTGPAELELRSALRELTLAWTDRLAALQRPPSGTEEDRAERQRLADRQAALTQRTEQALRAIDPGSR